jgi:hypothetical protein
VFKTPSGTITPTHKTALTAEQIIAKRTGQPTPSTSPAPTILTISTPTLPSSGASMLDYSAPPEPSSHAGTSNQKYPHLGTSMHSLDESIAQRTGQSLPSNTPEPLLKISTPIPAKKEHHHHHSTSKKKHHHHHSTSEKKQHHLSTSKTKHHTSKHPHSVGKAASDLTAKAGVVEQTPKLYGVKFTGPDLDTVPEKNIELEKLEPSRGFAIDDAEKTDYVSPIDAGVVEQTTGPDPVAVPEKNLPNTGLEKLELPRGIATDNTGRADYFSPMEIEGFLAELRQSDLYLALPNKDDANPIFNREELESSLRELFEDPVALLEALARHLKVEEAAAIRLYTGESFKEINVQLRHNALGPGNLVAAVFYRALKKLETFTGNPVIGTDGKQYYATYRGIKLMQKKQASLYTVGKRVREKSILSVSTNLEVAKTFGNYVVEFRLLPGSKDIAKLSKWHAEHEIIVLPRTQFRIVARWFQSFDPAVQAALTPQEKATKHSVYLNGDKDLLDGIVYVIAEELTSDIDIAERWEGEIFTPPEKRSDKPS